MGWAVMDEAVVGWVMGWEVVGWVMGWAVMDEEEAMDLHTEHDTSNIHSIGEQSACGEPAGRGGSALKYARKSCFLEALITSPAVQP